MGPRRLRRRITDNMRPIVVFSDVDGALKHLSGPMLGRAANTLRLLGRYRIWTVLCSGMPRAEIELLQRGLELRQPFITEGGAAAFIPRGYFGYELPDACDDGKYVRVEFARPYAHSIEVLRDTANRLGIDIIGLSDMSTEDVARECGLPICRARAAKMREYSEPIRLDTVNEDRRACLIAALEAADISCISRGRFDHVGSVSNCTPSVKYLCDRFTEAFGPVTTIGVVDAMADDHLVPLVDYQVMLHADATPRGATDLAGWVRAIGATAQRVRQQELDRHVSQALTRIRTELQVARSLPSPCRIVRS
jgi:predicted mannosyl-3-phosphoglycerate phosphatase (HAD superfamily)